MQPIKHISHLDLSLCLRFNHASQYAWVRRLFRTISRLGDGVFWYTLMILLLILYRVDAVLAVVHMLLAGGACTLLYKWLKQKISRPRPYQVNTDIECITAPLDRFSFPSGHTLHAVAFSIVAVAYYPGLAWIVFPFTFLVAISRMVLGLHYPSDVLAGALIGFTIARLSFLL
ncbi:MAG: phosphatase PAP2 family protein [Burkholderiales bacterium]|nr:phosphatase PAP2 family protein [Burkholderiales bacterium]